MLLEKTEQQWQQDALKALEAPALARHLAWWMLLALLASSVLLVMVPWQQNVYGTGQVIAFSPLERRQEIEAPIKGRIKAWYVQESSRVKKGELIAEIQDNDPEYFERLQRQRETLINQLNFNQSKVMAYDLRLQDYATVLGATVASAQAKVEAAGAKLDLAQRELEGAQAEQITAQQNLTRERALRERGLTSERNFELASLSVQKSQAEVNKAKAKIAEARSELRQAQAEKTKARAEAQAKQNSADANLQEARASVEKSRAELLKIETALARQTTQLIKAPRDGTILKLNTFSDTVFVKEGDKLATLVPDTSERAVELYMKGNDIPLIEVGREVRLQFEGWPALQFSGWPQAAVGTFAAKVVLIDTTDSKEGKFRIVVRPLDPKDPQNNWPDERFLRQGAQAKGWVLLDTVPLGFELWRQFNGFPPQMQAPEKPESQDLIKRKVKK